MKQWEEIAITVILEALIWMSINLQKLTIFNKISISNDFYINFLNKNLYIFKKNLLKFKSLVNFKIKTIKQVSKSGLFKIIISNITIEKFSKLSKIDKTKLCHRKHREEYINSARGIILRPILLLLLDKFHLKYAIFQKTSSTYKC